MYRNTVNDKAYVGQTTQAFKNRHRDHVAQYS